MIDTIKARNGTPIRLRDERWVHITEEPADLAGPRQEILATIEEPDRIYL